ncbi:hypothetical protein T02_10902 [Trichinella nativa]|uniref:Uncharacterized protein n=1 Tax=Trichinella nativa TaxID=6335 RepID=A0A0V1LK58_9BILA|nr:hypothetical protein T06_14930 [Trichinella sp. T6]KRZ59866.1 hypothetical protein T02_10902 [Trichinella nativa]
MPGRCTYTGVSFQFGSISLGSGNSTSSRFSIVPRVRERASTLYRQEIKAIHAITKLLLFLSILSYQRLMNIIQTNCSTSLGILAEARILIQE